MEQYKPLNKVQINLLEDAIKYSSSEDSNGSDGNDLAAKLNEQFDKNPPKISQLTKEKIIQYNIIASVDVKELYRTVSRKKFKGLFGRLKKAGYKGPDEKGMKNYSNMTDVEMWNYFSEIRKDLNIFS